jgi:hypothetical protein
MLEWWVEGRNFYAVPEPEPGKQPHLAVELPLSFWRKRAERRELCRQA